MVSIPNVGFKLKALHLKPGVAAWDTASQSGNLSVANGATIPDNFETFNGFAQQTLPGVTYNARVQPIGTPYVIHRPPSSSTNWVADALTADQNAFPSPNTDEDNTPMLRSLLTPNYPGSGSVAPWNDLLFVCWAPGNTVTPRGSLATFYFNGPAGNSLTIPSGPFNPQYTGQYALKVRGDGSATLYELSHADGTGNQVWTARYSFQWGALNSGSAWTMIQIVVVKRMWLDANQNILGDRITFGSTTAGQSPSQYSPTTSLSDLTNLNRKYQKGQLPTYTVPRSQVANMITCPIRMDIAVDCRASFAASKHIYPSGTGHVRDDLFSYDQPTSGQVVLAWNGVLFGDGSSWSANMYDQLGNALSLVSTSDPYTTNKGQTSYAVFQASSGMTGSSVQFNVTGASDGTGSPVITDYAVLGQATYQFVNPITPFTIPNSATPPALYSQVIESVSINPQTTDPGSEDATIVVNDLTGELDFLEGINMIPVHLWTTNPNVVLNPSGATTTLFRGYCLVANGERMRTNPGQIYPNPLWTRWTLHCVGEWARIMDATLPRKALWTDYSTNNNALVTNVVRQMHESVYPRNMVVVPDSGIRLFGSDPSTWVAEPGTRCADLAQDWMRDYFGGWNLFDYGVGDSGAMRAFFQRTPPYNNTTVFEMDHPTFLAGDGVPRIPQWAASYGTTNVGGQIQQHVPMFAGSYESRMERAEGNAVLVFGGGVNADAQSVGGTDAVAFTQVAVKVDSYNFLNLSPTDPGYPNGSSPEYFGRLIPIRSFLYTLPNQSAVDWYCRRIYDRSCFARYYISFRAPLCLVTDATDPYQTNPRALRYYDPVLVRQYDGSLRQFLVVSCMPDYNKDRIQTARYLLVTQSNINQIGVIPRQASDLLAMLKATSRLKGIDLRNGSENYSQMKQGAHISSEIMSLPLMSNNPIQILDNRSPYFGQFYAMSGYGQGGILH